MKKKENSAISIYTPEQLKEILKNLNRVLESEENELW